MPKRLGIAAKPATHTWLSCHWARRGDPPGTAAITSAIRAPQLTTHRFI